MKPTIGSVTGMFDRRAPILYQESYDNSGLLAGEPHHELKGILLTLDCTEAVVEEAIAQGCNLIIAHHPIWFRPLKKLTGANYVERTILKAIRNEVAIYASHTNLDNQHEGVNRQFCSVLGLEHCRVLQPKTGTLRKLTTFVPAEYKEAVTQAMYRAGAGNIGNYSECSFQLQGTGTFRPNEQANPHIGSQQILETVEETRVEVLLPVHAEQAVLQALQAAHPYEEVAYYLHTLENANQEIGSGMIGELAEPLAPVAFLAYLKERLHLSCIRHTELPESRTIRKVAVCGGTGSFLIRQAVRAGADAFVTADLKYHEFFDAEGKLLLADVGHYESEIATVMLFERWLKEAFGEQLRLVRSRVNTNPVRYFAG